MIIIKILKQNNNLCLFILLLPCPGAVNVQVPVVFPNVAPQYRDLLGAHPLPPVQLAQPTEVGTGPDEILHRGHRELVAPQYYQLC